MSLSIDLTTHGKELQQVYDRIISGSPDTSWAVFSYDKGNSNELKVQSEGSGELDEIVDEFSDGRVSYGFVRVEDPNTKLNKFVLIGWCGEGVPEHRKGLFHSHFVTVAKFLKGYHVQITARSEADIDPSTIMNKVADSSGSKYSQILSKFETSPKSSRGPPISPSVSAAFGRSSGYRASTINKDDDGWGGTPELKESAPSTVKTAYVPTKVDMAALRAGKSDTTSSGPEVVKSTYTPIGRVDIAALRAQAQQDSPQPSYVGTTGYTPVSLPKPKPISSRFGPTVSSTGGTVAPMPSGPKRESKVIGGASKNFGTDASGKTPSQLWAERKARQGGNQPLSVVPDIAPQSPLPRATAPAPTPVNSGQYVEDSSDVIGKPSSGGVAAMRERFARQSLEESDRPPISPSMGGRRPSPVTTRPVIEPEEEEEEVSAPPPPPIAISSKPPPARNFQSLDHVVAAGAGAGIGLGVGALASRHTEPEPEPEPEEEEHPAHETWDTTQPAEEEDEEDLAARHRAQIHAEQIEEPEPEEEPLHHEEEHEQPSAETGAQSAKTAIVLFEYEAQEENEISLIEGQIITNVEFVDEGWWSGESPSGHSGLFPSNYVELQEHDAGDVPAVPLSTSAPAPHEPEPVADEGETAIAEYEYEAQEENELSFPEGARIINIERVDENWWAGEYDGKTGLFPSNYVNAE